MESRTFETNTVQGIKAAERYKAKLEGKYERVTVTVIGLECVKIWGVSKSN